MAGVAGATEVAGAEWLTEDNSANGSFGVAGALLEAKSANGSFSATGAEWLTEANSANGSFGVAGALLEAKSDPPSKRSFSATGAEWANGRTTQQMDPLGELEQNG